MGAIDRTLSAAKFDVVINCAAEANLDDCETHPDSAKRLNADAPGTMAEVLSRTGGRLIHISTDYVFDGQKAGGYYTEDDEALPISVYGRTKLAGENAVLGASARHVVMRVSWLFGQDKPSFVDALIDRALESDKVEAVGDKTSCPTFSEDVAGWMEPFLSGLRGGLYHACNSGRCSWRDYAEHAIRIAAAQGAPVKTIDVDFIRMEDIPGFADLRPCHTAMRVDKLVAETGIQPRPWQDAVAAYVRGKFPAAS